MQNASRTEKMVPGSRQDKSSSNPSQKREICLTKKNSLQRENHKIKYTSQIYFKYKSQINFTSAELSNLFSTRSKKSGAVQGGPMIEVFLNFVTTLNLYFDFWFRRIEEETTFQ